MESDEGLYHATPQTMGKIAHKSVDDKTASHRKDDLLSLPVYSEKFGLMGKVDFYKQKEKTLIERKYQLKQIFRGQIYQLWAQYFCLKEMGYEVEKIAFYEISTKRMIHLDLPDYNDEKELKDFIEKYRNYSPQDKLITNDNKCSHCIYCNLCDKSNVENVYQ